MTGSCSRSALVGVGRRRRPAQYASGLVEFAGWADERGLLGDLVTCARNLALFQLHLRTSPVSRRGRGHGRARSNDRVSDVMSCVRSFYRFQVRRGGVPSSVNELLYEVVAPAGGSMSWLEDLPALVARPVDTLPRSGESEPVAASFDEYVAMMAAPGTARDKLLVTVLALGGLRIGQALGLRRSDMRAGTHRLRHTAATRMLRAGCWSRSTPTSSERPPFRPSP